MNLLIADDHKLIIHSYKMIIESSDLLSNSLNIIEAFSCKDVFEIVNEVLLCNNEINIAIIDYSMPSFKEANLFNGVDVCKLLKNKFPNCKIIILTSIIENIKLFDIVKNINPDGIALKVDIDCNNFIDLILDVLNGNRVKTKNVIKQFNDILNNEVLIKEQNRIILEYLSIGFKIKEIAIAMGVSEISVKKRISTLKKSFDLNADESLIKKVKSLGLI